MGRMSDERLVQIWADNPKAFELEKPHVQAKFKDAVQDARKAKKKDKPKSGAQTAPPKAQTAEG